MPDINVLVDALRDDSAFHEPSRRFVLSLTNGPVEFAWTSSVFTGVVRIATSMRIYHEPVQLALALRFCDLVRSASRAVQIEPHGKYWPTFTNLLNQHDLSGGDVSDAALAAIAIEHGCTLVTWDRGFLRFSGLDAVNPETALKLLAN
ncbi:MAG: TA system VapC family ribonuclease toxin [Fimbriimonadales bacterium]